MRYLILIKLLLSCLFFETNGQNYTWKAQAFEKVSSTEYVPAYYHKARKALAVNPQKYPNQLAAVQKVFDGNAGTYTLQLHTLTEIDGECRYQVFINKAQIGTFTNPRTSVDYQPASFSISAVNLQKGDTIRITFQSHSNQKIPEGKGFAYARGRWTHLDFFIQEHQEYIELKKELISYYLGKNGIQANYANQNILSSLDGAHWSIATNWKNGWPSQWFFATPETIEKNQHWTILTGAIDIPNKGTMLVRDAYRLEKGILKGVRRWEWKGIDTLHKATLAIQFRNPASNNRILMPGIQYYGNPSGQKSGATPYYLGHFGERALYEEHRFPMPFVHQEVKQGANYFGTSLHSLPSLSHYGKHSDQWWSLGCEAIDEGTVLTLLSGPCASNGKNSVVKARQAGDRFWESYDEAWLSIPPNAIIEKTFYIDVYKSPIQQAGSTFLPTIRTNIDLFDPLYLNGLPNYREIIEEKYQFAQTRWIEGKGFNQFDPAFEKGAYVVIGWVGQAAAMGYALQQLAPILRDEKIPQMVQQSLDLLSQTQFYEQGFRTWYNVQEEKWGDRIWRPKPEWLSQGQGMFNMANAIQSGRIGGYDTALWEDFLRKAAEFHANRILQEAWQPKSTNEAFFIAPLCLAHQLFQEELFLKAAKKAGDYYITRHHTMEEPYWGGTLDAKCEDKEGAFGAFQGFLYLFETTQDPNYLLAAEHACATLLSYTYVWDVDLPPGRLRDHNFKSRGWTSVSVQNIHLDVYGVLLAPFIYRLGQIQQDQQLKEIAKLMFRTCGQLIDPYGSQGEQIQHTNYTQDKEDVRPFSEYRGGYVEDWTVFWITAHFLNAAALFEEFRQRE